MHVLSTVDALLVLFASFGLALAGAALLGVGWQGGFYSHMFPDFYHGWISVQFGCLVVQVITHLVYLLVLALSHVRSVHSLEGSAMFLG